MLNPLAVKRLVRPNIQQCNAKNPKKSFTRIEQLRRSKWKLISKVVLDCGFSGDCVCLIEEEVRIIL